MTNQKWEMIYGKLLRVIRGSLFSSVFSSLFSLSLLLQCLHDETLRVGQD